jgi:hypothetical protein
VSRLVIGNLAAEIDMARAATPGPHPDVSPAALQLIRRHALLLSIFGDRLWLPGDPWPPPPAEHIVAWAETDAVATLRTSPVACRLFPGEWQEDLWQLHCDPAIARRSNDRRFAFALAEQNGWSLPGARVIESLDHLPGTGTWLAKAPYSAAGRERVRFTGSEHRTRLARLLARFGALLVEPWVDRVLDLGCAGLVADTVQVFSPHRLEVDRGGVFRAAIIDDSGASIAEPAILGQVRGTAEAAGDALRAAGYRGPFSIDAYLWRDEAGAPRLQRLSEINARLTFGLVARAAAERERPGGGQFELRL